MSNFRSALPFNRTPGETSGHDAALDIFSQAYLEGTDGVEMPLPPNATSQSLDSSTSEVEDQNWVDQEGAPTPAAKASGPSNGRWYYWDGTKSLPVQLHNNVGILSIWLPQEPTQIITVQSGQGAAGGVGIYNTNPITNGQQVASEVIAIPSGHESLTLTASAPFAQAIFVLVSGEAYIPSKTYSPIGKVTFTRIAAGGNTTIAAPGNNSVQLIGHLAPAAATITFTIHATDISGVITTIWTCVVNANATLDTWYIFRIPLGLEGVTAAATWNVTTDGTPPTEVIWSPDSVVASALFNTQGGFSN